MSVNEPARIGLDPVETPVRAEWTRPSVTRLHAGAAENRSGNTINDTALERIAS